MSMTLSCTFASSINTPEHIRVAEKLGYEHAWCFYSPAIYADPWMMLARAAERTTRIGLGVSVVVPKFQHVADTASCTATLHALAPGRVTIVVGAGFSSSALLGGKGSTWAAVEQYITNVRALLKGETVVVNGDKISLLHVPESGISLPIEVPIWAAAHGPKGFAVANRVADGVITNPSHGDDKPAFDGPYSFSYYGTVLEPGETLDDEAVIERTGATAALALHMGPYGPIADTPEELGFRGEIAQLPEEDQLVATHCGHLIAMSELDRKYMTGNVIKHGTLTGAADHVLDRLRAMEQAGATHFHYTPVGPDIPRELEALAKVAANL